MSSLSGPAALPDMPFREPAGQARLAPAPVMAEVAGLSQATVARPSYCSVPGPSASTVAAPAGPTCQQRLPGGASQGQPGARVPGGAVQLRGGLRGPGVSHGHGEGWAPCSGRSRTAGAGAGTARLCAARSLNFVSGPLPWAAEMSSLRFLGGPTPGPGAGEAPGYQGPLRSQTRATSGSPSPDSRWPLSFGVSVNSVPPPGVGPW